MSRDNPPLGLSCSVGRLAASFLVVIAWDARGLAQTPPFSGTAFLDADILLATDPSAFDSFSYVGLAPRLVFDRRENAFVEKDMHLFEAAFADGLAGEIQVNPEFGGPDAA